MKILFIITGLGRGGAETQLALLSKKFIDMKFDVSIIYFFGDVNVVIDERVSVYKIRLERKKIIDVVKLLFKLRRKIKIINPDVIHSHMIHANILSRLVRCSLKINKLISTAHSTYEGKGMISYIYKKTNFLSDFFSNVSQSGVLSFERSGLVNKGEMKCIYNGIDTNYFKKIKTEVSSEFHFLNNKKIIVTVGRLYNEKNHELLIKSFHLVYKKLKNTHLLIVGDGPERDKLEKLTQFLKIDKNVSFLGVRNDIPEILSISSVFVLSSKWEGFGLSLAEAMSCECPVITTDSGGVSEVVGDFGSIIKNNDEEEMSQEIVNILTMKDDLLIKRKIEGRCHIVKNFSIDNIKMKWLEIYKNDYK